MTWEELRKVAPVTYAYLTWEGTSHRTPGLSTVGMRDELKRLLDLPAS